MFARYQTYESQEVLKNVKPEKVWEYVADFSKMKALNPSILEFKILSDHGNNDDWKYTVEYIENLTYWPYWRNKATGNYHVKKIIKNMKQIYLVESTHKTCFFGVYCGETQNLSSHVIPLKLPSFDFSQIHRRISNHWHK